MCQTVRECILLQFAGKLITANTEITSIRRIKMSKKNKRNNNRNIVEELSRNLSESAREPIPTDIDGAYTGSPVSTEDDMPVQDADDL